MMIKFDLTLACLLRDGLDYFHFRPNANTSGKWLYEKSEWECQGLPNVGVNVSFVLMSQLLSLIHI